VHVSQVGNKPVALLGEFQADDAAVAAIRAAAHIPRCLGAVN